MEEIKCPVSVSPGNHKQDFLKSKKLNKYLKILSGILLIAIIGILIFISINLSNNNKTAKASNLKPEIILDVVNQQRLKAGLTPLKADPRAMQAAQAKASDMAAGGYFAHYSPTTGKRGISFMPDHGLIYSLGAENLAVYFTDTNALVNGWMNSPGHRKNILNPGFELTGIGVAAGVFKGHQTFFIAQMFATELPQQAIPQAQKTPSQLPTNPSNTAINTSPAQNSSNPDPQPPAKPEEKPLTEQEKQRLQEEKRKQQFENSFRNNSKTIKLESKKSLQNFFSSD